ncbi:hypothetical protein [Acetivibrio mesophilus]|uniref:Uncharacterized protein n=1 Tax=Acetivibrio mesophilus TaxID=2487273 RepID=A0A4Q0I3W3_9FIRM|nr:hypothetical protein [Acetivibrio mesophilus]ODM27772.1 hypothetical protein A7W90_16985 [Clostridium sp. Bc-iso-3]RXE58973.1 hypothetical protein EFD62_09235 [Acetivibrio mesophilus]HHV29335.1 hypothetical protein [Clostridium sp.]
MRKALLMVVLSDLVLYVLQFLIIPLIYDNVIGRGNEAIAVLCITTVLITAAGMIVFSDKLRFWLLGALVYALLITLYSPEGAYGIGISGIDLDGLHSYYDASKRYFGIALVVILVTFLQLLVWCLVKLSKVIIGKLNN